MLKSSILCLFVMLSACTAELRHPVHHPQPPPVVVVQPPAPPAPVELTLKTIYFKSGSAEMTDAGKMAVDDMALAIYRLHCNLVIYIDGNTDSTGTLDGNNKLAFARANSVSAWMSEDLMPSEEISIIADGVSEFLPVADNRTVEGRAANRRVGINIVVLDEAPDVDIIHDRSMNDGSTYDNLGTLKMKK